MLKRLQLFTIDSVSGRKISGVPLQLFYRPQKADHETQSCETPAESPASDVFLAAGQIRQTDHAGFCTFDLQPLRERERRQEISVAGIEVRPIAGGGTPLSIDLDEVEVGEGSVALFPFPIDPDQIPSISGEHFDPAGYPSIPNPEPADWRASPESFGFVGLSVIGEDGCRQLLPSHVPDRRDRFWQIEPSPMDGPRRLDAAEINQECEPPLQGGEFADTLCYKTGRLIEFETVWQPLNHGLGNVIYSLSLAPCEATRIAVVNWARSERDEREEDQRLDESLVHNMRRDRTIEEVVDATVKEWQKGRSFLGGTAGVGGYGGNSSGQNSGQNSSGMDISSASGSLWSVTGSHALGMGKASTRGERTIEADTSQSLNDTISQAGNASRRLHGTVITESSQAESETLQTRMIRNHNHRHAMTVLYYEVLRHYCVTTRAARERDVIFVRFELENFDRESLIRHRDTLAAGLLDHRLREGFDAAEALVYDPEPPPLPEREIFVHALRYEMYVGSNDSDRPGSEFNLYYELVDGSEHKKNVSAQRHLSNGWMQPRVVVLDSPVEVSAIRRVGIQWLGGGKRRLADEIDIEELRVTYLDEYSIVRDLYYSVDHGADRELPTRLVDNETIWSHVLDSATSMEEEPEPGPTLTQVRQRRADRLLTHIRYNRLYYSRLIWLAEDPDLRLSRFDRFAWEEGRLSDYIDPWPLDVHGNYLAFAVGGYREIMEENQGRHERIVSIPTRGSFAEAKLSDCNSAEDIDPTKYWDWTESPCPDQPPEISALQAGSRAGSVDAGFTAMADKILQLMNAEDAPDPSGMASAMALLATANIFRDMSATKELGSLLGELTRAAAGTNSAIIGSLSENRAPATGGASAAGGGATTGSGSSEGGGSGQQSARAIHDFAQTARAARERGQITPEQEQGLVYRRLEHGAENPTLIAGGGGSPLSDDRAVPRRADDANQEILAPYHSEYESFRQNVLEVPTTDGNRSIAGRIIYRSDYGAIGGQLVDEAGLRHLHEALRSASNGDLIRLLFTLYRDPEMHVMRITIEAPDIDWTYEDAHPAVGAIDPIVRRNQFVSERYDFFDALRTAASSVDLSAYAADTRSSGQDEINQMVEIIVRNDTSAYDLTYAKMELTNYILNHWNTVIRRRYANQGNWPPGPDVNYPVRDLYDTWKGAPESEMPEILASQLGIHWHRIGESMDIVNLERAGTGAPGYEFDYYQLRFMEWMYGQVDRPFSLYSAFSGRFEPEP